MNVFTQIPVCDAIARNTSTWHHLTRTFQCVCRTWRTAAREEAFRRVDRVLESVRATLVSGLWRTLRERPFSNAHVDTTGFFCDRCRRTLDARVHNVWFAYNHPSRDYDLCTACHDDEAIINVHRDGEVRALQFVNMSFGDAAPYCMFWDESMQRFCMPMHVPLALQWPRHVPPPRPCRLGLVADMYFGRHRWLVNEPRQNEIPLSTLWYQHPATQSCVDCGRVAYDFFDYVARDDDDGNDDDNDDDYGPERGSTFNFLDWLPVDIEINDVTESVIHHVVCVNPSRRQFYGKRARIVDGSWEWGSACRTCRHVNALPTRRLVTERFLSSHLVCSPPTPRIGGDGDAFPSASEIGARAYDIWQRTRRDDATANWLQAERELRDAQLD